MSRMTIDDVRAFVVPIRLRQLARQEGYCEVAVDVRLLADMLAVVDAAEAAGPWPKTVQSGPWFDCRHCGRSGFGHEHESYYRAIEHAPDCPGIALRDALTATTRGEGDDA